MRALLGVASLLLLDRFFEITHALLIDDYHRDVAELAQRIGESVDVVHRMPQIVAEGSSGTTSSGAETRAVPLLVASPGSTCASTAP